MMKKKYSKVRNFRGIFEKFLDFAFYFRGSSQILCFAFAAVWFHAVTVSEHLSSSLPILEQFFHKFSLQVCFSPHTENKKLASEKTFVVC